MPSRLDSAIFFAVLIGCPIGAMIALVAGFGDASIGLATAVCCGTVAVWLYQQPDDGTRWSRTAPKLLALFFVAPTLAALIGAWFGHSVRKSEAEEREARERESDRLHAVAARDAAAHAAAQARRQEAQRRAEQEALAREARRTPEERAAIILDLVEGRGDAGASWIVNRVCEARRQAARLGEDASRIDEVRSALRALARAERVALREERDAARESRMVRCCDGNLSPSCECRRSSYRGCCSWHGGVCGCEPLPTEISCQR